MTEINGQVEWWCLDWFDKETDKHIGDENFTGLTTPDVKKIFGDLQEFVADVYEVKEAHRLALQPFINHQIDLDKFDYYFSACAI